MWERQLNCLRWLAMKNGYPVEKLQVIAIFRDWQRSKAARDENYPPRNVMVIDVPVWSLEEEEAYILNRVVMHQQSDLGADIECTEEERWYSGTTFALMKDGGKRAKRVVSIKEELGPIPDGHHVVERPGVNRRCEGFCEVAPFCTQYQKIRAASPEEPTDDVDY